METIDYLESRLERMDYLENISERFNNSIGENANEFILLEIIECTTNTLVIKIILKKKNS